MTFGGGSGIDDCIYCIGDSHVSFFSGVEAIQPMWPRPTTNLIPFFRAFRIGAVLAWSLAAWDSRTRGREVVAVILDRHAPESEKQVPPGARVLLCFGEIDCRCHVVPQVRKTGDSMETVIDRLAERYCRFIGEVSSWGYRPLVWNVIPSSPRETGGTREYPIIGTCAERNHATRLFNVRLATWCRDANVDFVDIFDQLVDGANRTRPEFLMDDVHLSQTAMPFVVDWVREHFPELVPADFDLPNPDAAALNDVPGDYPLFPPKRKKTLAHRVARLLKRR